MKTEISRESHQPGKNYSGVYQQQGRMLTDADWNEMVDILKHRLKDGLKDVVGNRAGSQGGTPRHRPLRVKKESAADPLSIEAGRIYIDGMAAGIEKNSLYTGQLDFPAPPQPVPDDCTLYVDVWERTVTHLTDPRLRDAALHGADTCTRKQVMAQVKWCPSGTDPEKSEKNPRKGDAELTITLRKKTTLADPCDPCAAQLEVDSSVGNYLYRVEIHDVKGDANDPDEITIKWSSENGGEQQGLKNENGDDIVPPATFTDGQYSYELFDEESEKHQGVHLAPGFSPSREELTGGYPPAPSRNYARRWDGYCTLEKVGGNWTVTTQFDVSQPVSGTTSFTSIAAGVVTIQLDARELVLEFGGKSIVAGDFWMVDVREDSLPIDSILLEQATPQGIEHHYLTLGKMAGGSVQDNPEEDRKYGFPTLSEMTRLFLAGGDGQEVVPGEVLPQPLRVGVANGEWPVHGATVRFHVEEGGGTLNPVNGGVTNAQGIAECLWTPGSALNTKYRVRATLVDPENESDTGMDLRPPVYFYANLVSAEQVGYEAACSDSTQNSVLKRLQDDPSISFEEGSEGYYTVKRALDGLLCEVKASHLPYQPESEECWEGLTPPGTNPPETVQEALDTLCAAERGGGCCTITISAGEDLATRLNGAIAAGGDAHICLTVGEYVVKDPLLLEGLGNITFHGCGEGTVIRTFNSEAALIFNKCTSVSVKHMRLHSHGIGEKKDTPFDTLNGTLTIHDVDDVVVEDLTLSCAEGGRRMASCLTVAHTEATDSLRISGCRVFPGDQQVGILVVNGNRVRITDNRVRVKRKSQKKSFKKRLKDKQYRLSIRKIMISNVIMVDNTTPEDKKRNVQLDYEGRLLRFNAPNKLVPAWKNIQLMNGLDDRDVIRHVKDVADAYLLNLASGENIIDHNIKFFAEWFEEITPHLPAIALQGIVCGGKVAGDICITKNSVHGANQGIHVGLSQNDDKNKEILRVGRLFIEANHVITSLSEQKMNEGHGIFSGNFACLHIQDNRLELMKFPWDLDATERNMNGIRVHGHFGDMLQIRGNHLNNYRDTIFAMEVAPSKKEFQQLWQVENNMLSGMDADKPFLDPEPSFVVGMNYPYP